MTTFFNRAPDCGQFHQMRGEYPFFTLQPARRLQRRHIFGKGVGAKGGRMRRPRLIVQQERDKRSVHDLMLILSFVESVKD